MKKLVLMALFALAACTSAQTTPATAINNASTGTHVQNDTGHPCSVADTRHGSCY